MLAECIGKRLDFLLHWQRGEIASEQRFAHAVEDEFGAAYFLKGEPEGRRFKAAGLVEPLQEAARQSSFAHASQSLDQCPSGGAAHGTLHVEDGAIASNEAVGVLFAAQFL